MDYLFGYFCLGVNERYVGNWDGMDWYEYCSPLEGYLILLIIAYFGFKLFKRIYCNIKMKTQKQKESKK